MLSENFDKKIKELTEDHATNYDGQSWDKMEQILAKHLPEKKKDRRRFFFLLFSFLILGGGAFILLGKPFGEGQSITVNTESPTLESSKPRGQSGNKDNAVATNKEATATPSSNTGEKADNGSAVIANTTAVVVNTDNDKNISPVSNTNTKTGLTRNLKTGKNNISGSTTKTTTTSITTTTTTPTTIDPAPGNQTTVQSSDPIPVNTTIEKHGIQPGEGTLDEELKEKGPQISPHAVSSPAFPKRKKNILSNVALTFSAGPDISSVGSRAGKLEAVYGVGLSYAFSKRFSFRTGIFSAKKVYTANPGDYDPPQDFWALYPELKKIDADCRVYEIPFLVDYNFIAKPGHSFFASAGVTTIVMRKETYSYLFKPPYSPDYMTYKHTYHNGTSHNFAMLSLSAGYTKHLNNSVSLRAEPYARIPLSGIGYGKIKLKSGGVLFTLAVKPFVRKN
jgi:hypothetical protein